ncbi:MAG: decaprenyl-phosphate phosphoribosyltransferase [SAR202 cluster bacterium Io17-Chloro-G4]|nr:MAG: decaprenyl-phosphate phosphoribosyltransferase [SAR202 cluster bacterium Io17-Chloro-G4]
MGAADKISKSFGSGLAASAPAALVKALRPQQWVKNALVFLPFLFAIEQAWSLDNLDPVPELIGKLFIVFAGYCALSAAVYLFNDLSDRKADQQHPVKKHRPIASGKVGVPMAVTVMVALTAAGLAATFLVELVLGGIGLIYLAINVAYSLGLKRIVLVDVMAVASGYVIRAVAGAVAIDVTPSPWLYATTAAAALFIVVGRRYAEVRLAGDEASEQRSVLGKYAGPFISQLLTITATAAWLSYTLYTVEADNLPQNNTMLLTIPLVSFGLFRYLYLLNTSKEAEAPEQLIMRDVPLVLSIVGWIVAAVLVLILND